MKATLSKLLPLELCYRFKWDNFTVTKMMRKKPIVLTLLRVALTCICVA